MQKQLLTGTLEPQVGSNATTRRSRVLIDRANRTLTFVPLVFICLRVWGTLRFLINTADPHHELDEYFAWLAPLQVWLVSGLAFGVKIGRRS